MKKRIMNVIFWAAVIYMAILTALYINQRNMIYAPDKSRPARIVNVAIANVITEDGLKLEGWYLPAKAGMPTILYYHGNASNHAGRLPKVATYINEGYGMLLAGYRGYGGNPGSPSEQGFYKDARAYVKFLKDKNVPPDKTIIYGESIGTGVAVQMATEYKAAAMILEAPFSSTVDVAKNVYPFIPVKYLLKDQYRSKEKIGNVHYPILIIHGEKDRLIPFKFGKKLNEAANDPHTFIPLEKAGHNDLYDYGAAAHVLDFLKKLGLSSRSDVDPNSHN